MKAVKLAIFITILLSVMASTHASANPNLAQLYFYARLSGFDDRIPILSTSTFVFNLRIQEPTNESFHIVLLFAHPNNATETMDLEYSSFQDSDGTQFLSTKDTAFYSAEWRWHLFECGGPFPWDSLCWYMLLGSTVPVKTAYPPQIYETQLVPSSWEISFPTLNPIDPTQKQDYQRLVQEKFDYRVLSTYLRPGLGYSNWYLVQMSFGREYADKVRLGFLFWIPAAGVLAAIVSPQALQMYARRRRSRFRLSLSQALTLYLSSALFSFPFILSVAQYAPKYAITAPEYLFYLDAGLAFCFTVKAVLDQYTVSQQSNRNRACAEAGEAG